MEHTPTIGEAIQRIEGRVVHSIDGQLSISDFLALESISFRAQAVATFRRMGHWEFAAAFVTTLYGVFLILPLDTLTIIGLAHDKNIFLRAAAEALWGMAFLLAGLNQWIGAWIDWAHWRIGNGLVIALIWGGIAWLYFGIYPGSTAGFLATVIVWCSTCGLVTLTKALMER